MQDIRIISGLITFMSEIPEAFIAVNSNFSPKLPNVMRDASRMASGSAIGTIETPA